ncbi:MAG: ACP S-malonyltransferase [Gemmataceae bacterium]
MTATAFLFPGQGAQTVGMAVGLTEHPAVRALFDQAAQILGYDLLQVCAEGPAEKLNRTDISQPAIFTASLAALEHLKLTEPELLGKVTATAGLSLGEYTALVFAGALSFEDGLKVVKARGEAMQNAALATPSGMVSLLGGELPAVHELVDECRGSDVLQVANLLCPGNTVVSGSIAAIERLEKTASERGSFKTIRLAVAGAFHTPIMHPADEQLAAALNTITLHPPRIPIYSNVDAQAHTDPAIIRQRLVRQVVAPVLWEESMRNVMASGIESFIEIGPGRVLAGLMKRIHRKADFRNVTA